MLLDRRYLRARSRRLLWAGAVGVNAPPWERVVVALLALAGVTFLGATGNIDGQAVVGIYSLILGYMLGHQAGGTAERLREALNGKDGKPHG